MNSYIENVESQIEIMKLNERKYFVDFSHQFKKGEKDLFLKHFLDLGYNVEVRKCRLGLYDIIITW
jgi:hypothetical protein